MEENNDRFTNSTFKLLQPDLMTVDELSEILRTCCVKNDLTSYSKSDLVELFKRVALPLPQREYSGTNWREKKLIKNQKRKASETIGNASNKKLCTTNVSNSASVSSTNNRNSVPCRTTPLPSVSPNTNRLKPPVNVNNYTKKMLKLALPTSSSTASPELKKVIINAKKDTKPIKNDEDLVPKKLVVKKEEMQKKITKSVTSSHKEKQTNGKHKRIVIDFIDSSITTTKTPKLVNLKRSTSNNEVLTSGQKIRKIINI